MAPTEQQFFAALQCIENYMEAQEQLGAALKDGLLNLARGKYTLGSALGQQRYPGDMQASVLLQPSPAADDDNLYEEFQLLQSISQQHAGQRHDSRAPQAGQQQEQQQEKQGPDASTAAGAAADVAGSAEAHAHSHTCSNNDPVAWFSALPPPPVRQAQSDFGDALQRAVAAANALQRLRQLSAGLTVQDEDAASDAS
jgi:hypothetical protein